MIIYKATNKINNKIYIGQTINSLRKRRLQHESSYKNKNTKDYVFARAMKKYGKENFTWEIIDTANSIEELNKKESYWILKLNSIVDNGKGYNSKGGGANSFLSEDTKRKIGEAQIGEKNHMWGRTGKLNPTSKKVINITDNVIYENATICSREENITLSCICSVCRGDNASAKGKEFRYLDKNGQIIPPKIGVKKQAKKVVNIDTNQLFNSIKEAELWLNHTSCNLPLALRNGNGVCYYCGYRWRYENVKVDMNNLPKKMPRKDAKKVMNLTTNTLYLSMTSVGKNYRNLATALRKGNGKCIWRKEEWEIVK